MNDCISGGSPGRQSEADSSSAGALLVRHREGNSAAFAEFVGLFRSRVYSYIVRCGVDVGARDDVFQEVFIKVHEAVAQYNATKAVEPWLFTLVANTVRSHFRRQSVRNRFFTYLNGHDRAASDQLHELSEARETAQWLEAQIAALPLAQREVLLLAREKQLSLNDIAGILKIPLNTVKTNLRRARIQLAKALAERTARANTEVT